MATTPNYNEVEVAGQSWQRAVRVVVENPYQGIPSIVYVEEKVYNVGDKIIKEPVSNLFVTFDQTSDLHVEIYTKLNDLYTLLREERDTAALAAIEAAAAQQEPPVTP